MQLNFDGKTGVDTAIERLQEWEPPRGYWVGYSGGKDSELTLDLVKRAGVKFDAHYSVTGIDPPELVHHIKNYHPEVEFHLTRPSFWSVLPKRGIPQRKGRWCCEMLKESCGENRVIVTGVRWAESPRRRSTRKVVEECYRDSTKIYVNPIIGWEDYQVWDYIKKNNLPYCSLYDEGWERLGCVMCPMVSSDKAKREMERWPKIANLWKRGIYKYWEKGTEGTKKFETPEALWQWFISRKGHGKNEDQMKFHFE